mgnify:CR=1 FL=1
MIDFGQDIQQALAGPRWLSGRFGLGEARAEVGWNKQDWANDTEKGGAFDEGSHQGARRASIQGGGRGLKVAPGLVAIGSSEWIRLEGFEVRNSSADGISLRRVKHVVQIARPRGGTTSRSASICPCTCAAGSA